MRLNRPKFATPQLKDPGFARWIKTMKEQDMLQSSVDLNKLVLP